MFGYVIRFKHVLIKIFLKMSIKMGFIEFRYGNKIKVVTQFINGFIGGGL